MSAVYSNSRFFIVICNSFNGNMFYFNTAGVKGVCGDLKSIPGVQRKLLQGSYREVTVKFKDFSRTSRLFNSFQGLVVYEKY